MKKYLFCVFFIFLFCFGLKGQIKVTDVGFSTGWGYALNGRSLPEGAYRLVYFQGMLRTQILPDAYQRDIFEAVYLGAEPQYNLVWTDQKQENFEAGVHFFLQPTFRLSERWKAFFIAGIGPHYFSATTISQAQGFIFADAVGLGLSNRLSSRFTVIANFRIRHLSNANTRLPNLGINTYNFHLGLVWTVNNTSF